MNKKQLIVIIIMIVLLSVIVLTGPRWFILRGVKNKPYGDYGTSLDWDAVIQRSIPVILISGVLMLIFKKRKE